MQLDAIHSNTLSLFCQAWAYINNLTAKDELNKDTFQF